MKKRIMALVLVSVLVLSAAFTGCSSQTEVPLFIELI